MREGALQGHDCTGGGSANNTFTLRHRNSLTLGQRGIDEPASNSASFVGNLLHETEEKFPCEVRLESDMQVGSRLDYEIV